MKRPLITALAAFLLFAPGASAQSWCPPGAEWTQWYNTVDWGTGYSTEGFVISRYMGDTLIGGFMAQHIDRDLYWRELGASEYEPGTYAPKYTRHEDGVVYHWNGQDMLDTLLWLGAGPGDHWFLPGGGNGYQFLVSDTATVIMEGIPLRRLAVSIIQLDGPYTLATDTLYERIGLVNGDTFDPLIVAVDGISSGFLCYGDETISFTNPGVEECGFTVNVAETAMDPSVRLWPNPGSSALHIETGVKRRTDVRMLDATGRVVLSASSPGGVLDLYSGGLAPGTYLIEVHTAEDLQELKWIKQ